MRDHHCVWVGQCIAERNRRSFLGFLILLAGLSFWFSRRVVMALSSGETSACRDDGRACKQAVWPHVLRHLLRTNRGGEDLGVAIYALTTGLLATALAAQQIFLVSAGLTSLELRRARKSPLLSHAGRGRRGTSSADRSADYSRSWQGGRRFPAPGSSLAPPPSPSAAAEVVAHVGETQPRDPSPPARFVSARDVAGNWARFLTGTELPSLR
ncbi:unnamed protein product [Ectocarpus sp. CCAP 1310/34]|nr:unnamed protein product [Ectocarpus sp. CCAP 1310/34]